MNHYKNNINASKEPLEFVTEKYKATENELGAGAIRDVTKNPEKIMGIFRRRARVLSRSNGPVSFFLVGFQRLPAIVWATLGDECACAGR